MSANIKDFHFHDLRHSFASWLAMRGVPIYDIAKLLGHKSVRMSERYAHLSPAHLRSSIAVLDNIQSSSGFSTKSAQNPVSSVSLPSSPSIST